MNLKTFLEYKTNCPNCDNALSTSVITRHKSYKIIMKENFLSFIISLRDLNSYKITKKVCISFSLNNNTFFVNFLSKDESVIYHYISFSLIRSLNQFIVNSRLWDLKFYRSCNICNCYYYMTTPSFTNLHMLTSRIKDIEIESEHAKIINDDKRYYIYNYPITNNTRIYYWSSYDKILHTKDNCAELELPLIPLLPKEKMLSRLKTLILFS